MKDQVDALLRRGIKAAVLNSSLSRHEFLTAQEDLRAGRLDMVYCAPERLNNEGFVASLKALPGGIRLLAVDEVCTRPCATQSTVLSLGSIVDQTIPIFPYCIALSGQNLLTRINCRHIASPNGDIHSDRTTSRSPVSQRRPTSRELLVLQPQPRPRLRAISAKRFQFRKKVCSLRPCIAQI